MMTLPLPETREQSLAFSAFKKIQKFAFDVLAMGPGLSQHPDTQRLVRKLIGTINKPFVIDADALNCLATDVAILKENCGTKILTPHPVEMMRLTKLPRDWIEKNRIPVAKEFAVKFNSVLLLKGHHSVVASPDGKTYINQTGNPGMATAGSGDVLTGMIAAFLGQGLSGFAAAKTAAYLHGKAGDLAAKEKTEISLIATDIIENIPKAIRGSQ